MKKEYPLLSLLAHPLKCQKKMNFSCFSKSFISPRVSPRFLLSFWGIVLSASMGLVSCSNETPTASNSSNSSVNTEESNNSANNNSANNNSANNSMSAQSVDSNTLDKNTDNQNTENKVEEEKPQALQQANQTVKNNQKKEPGKQAENKPLEIYWLNAEGENIKLVSQPMNVGIKGKEEPSIVLESALKKLLEGPTDESYTSTIPQGTQLRKVSIKSDGIHVNLSQEFTSGGGTSSMTGRVAQVLNTATSLDPNAKVWLEVEGETLEVLGGEGLLLEQPLTRKTFAEEYPL